MIRALFLDAAGTLIHPAEPVGDVYARVATAHGRPTRADEIGERFAQVFGSGLADPDWRGHGDGDRAERAWWRGLVAQVFAPAGAGEWAGFDACFEELFDHYASPRAWKLYPEVPPFLEEVRRRGLRTAVVSNFDRRLHRILEGHGLSFDLVLPSADACCRKPGREIFDLARHRLGVSPGEALHVGDSPAADRDGARAAGLEVVLLDRPEVGLLAVLDRLGGDRTGK